MTLTIRPLNSGISQQNHWSTGIIFLQKYVEKMGITNESDQLPDMTS